VPDEPSIPFDFDPSPSDYETAHLEYGNDGTSKFVNWPLIGVRISVADHGAYPDLQKLEELNRGTFKNWDSFGYTLGTYHEFFCDVLPAHAGFRFGSVEVTFGTVTPLAVYLYDNFHDDHYFDAWDHLSSARIIGCPSEDAEALFVNGALHYQNRFNVLPEPMRMITPEHLEIDETGDQMLRQAPATIDQHPLRFHYNGLAQTDDAAACIYFYRVLEYYAFLRNQQKISQLRHDHHMADDDFTRSILDLVFREEKGPVLQLINSIADEGILAVAQESKLISGKDSSQLGMRIYDFRNSIVHGKQSYGYVLSSAPILSTDVLASRWRSVLRQLSEKALQTLGRKYL
jgi:hypothetical protein